MASASYPVALYLQDAHPIRDGMAYAQYAEANGFAAVWQAESRLVREATVPLAAFASVTERIKVGSGVVDCWSRNPARLAATFSTLDDLAPGRVLLGIGAWWDPLAARVGINRAHPLTVMREIITAVRALLANETVSFYNKDFPAAPSSILQSPEEFRAWKAAREERIARLRAHEERIRLELETKRREKRSEA